VTQQFLNCPIFLITVPRAIESAKMGEQAQRLRRGGRSSLGGIVATEGGLPRDDADGRARWNS
jgi:hypothetical protein